MLAAFNEYVNHILCVALMKLTRVDGRFKSDVFIECSALSVQVKDHKPRSPSQHPSTFCLVFVLSNSWTWLWT